MGRREFQMTAGVEQIGLSSGATIHWRIRGKRCGTAIVALILTAGSIAGSGTLALGDLPLAFEQTSSPTSSGSVYIAHGPHYAVRLTPQGIDFRFPLPAQKQNGQSLFSIQFIGASSATVLQGINQQPGKSHYLLGDRSSWRFNVSRFSRVQASRIYPGIDIVYYGTDEQLEYDLIISPGANPSLVRLGFLGTDDVKIDKDHNLEIAVPSGNLRQLRPKVYQEYDGFRKAVACEYVLLRKNEVGIRLGKYNPKYQLIIDPLVTYATLLGGSGLDVGQAVAVDSNGNAYVTGYTSSRDFPVTPGTIQTTLRDGPGAIQGGYDVFVTKIAGDGRSILYSTYIGGANSDNPSAIRVDATGNVYVAGTTYSSDFPTTAGAFQPSFAFQTSCGLGGCALNPNGFLLKLNAQGTGLLYSTFIHGTDKGAWISAMTIDDAGAAYIVGTSESFPITPGAIAIGPNGFLAKLNPTGTALIYGTQIGADVPEDVAIDRQGNAYIGGVVFTNPIPVTPSAFQTKPGGCGTLPTSCDGFVMKISPPGTQLVYATYIGGSAYDQINHIAVDQHGNAWVSGGTMSTDFPVTADGAQRNPSGTNSCSSSIPLCFSSFVLELNSTGSGLIFSTYVAGYGEGVVSFTLDNAGSAILLGTADPAGFPGELNGALSGTQHPFLGKLSADGRTLSSISYFLGNRPGGFGAIALDAKGSAYLTGSVTSSGFPATPGAFQTIYGGGQSNVTAARIDLSSLPGVVTIATDSALPRATVSIAYALRLAAQGGALPYSNWILAAGILPPGLTLSPLGVLSGVPTSAGSFLFTIQMSDGSGIVATKQFVLVVDPAPPPLLISTDQLRSGTVDVTYSQLLTATGGTPPYTGWQVSLGTLPPGLTLSSDGLLSGTPSLAALFTLRVQVADKNGVTANKNFQVTINPLGTLTITTTSLLSGTVGVAYNQALKVIGGAPPYNNWRVISGSFPGGLSLSANGVVSGTPSSASGSPYLFTVQVSDSSGSTALAQLQIVVNDPSGRLQITSLSPNSVPMLDGDFELVINGQGFTPDSTVLWNGSQLRTSFVSTSVLHAIIDREFLSAPGTSAISVTLPGGIASNAVSFLVAPPPDTAPLITAVDPSNIVAGSPVSQIKVTGRNFQPSSQVRYNGRVLASSYVSSAELIAMIPKELIAQPGTAAIAVTSPPNLLSIPYQIGIVGLFTNPEPPLRFRVLAGTTEPVVQSVQVGGTSPNSTFTIGGATDNWLFATTNSNRLPALLTVSVIVNGLPVGDYTSRIVLQSPGSPNVDIPVYVTVQQTLGNAFDVQAPSMQFIISSTPNAQNSLVRLMLVQSRADRDLTVRTRSKQGNPWLKMSPDQTTVSPGQSVEIQVLVSPDQLPGGILCCRAFSDSIIVTAGGQSQEIPVIAVISDGAQPHPLISASAIKLYTLLGQNSLDSRDFLLYNAGSAPLNWIATAEGITIQVTPGFPIKPLDAGLYDTLTVYTTPNVAGFDSTVPAGHVTLRYGDQGDQVNVYTELWDRPRLPPRANLAGIILGPPGLENQKVKITNSSPQPLTFSVSRRPDWVSVDTASQQIQGNSTLELTFSTTGRDSSASDTITLEFPNYYGNNQAFYLNIDAKYMPAPIASNSSRFQKGTQAAACTGGRISGVFLQPENLFYASAGLPVDVRVGIVDDCGRRPVSASAIVTFSTGEPGLALTSWPDGTWRGVWQPKAAQLGLVTLRLAAAANGIQNIARAIISGTIASSMSIPTVLHNSTANSASQQGTNDTVTPGEILSIYGQNFASQVTKATNGVPLPTLSGVQVLLGGNPIPLFFVSPTQINALVPFALSIRQPIQLVVQRDGIQSVPLLLTPVPAQPGIFTTSQTGSGQGAILGPSNRIADAQNPVRRGDTISIFCTGLGPVDQVVDLGMPAPSHEPLPRVTGQVSVLIGNSPSDVTYAGLAPGFFGLYQVNARVPSDATSGDIPVQVGVGNLLSNQVTVSIKVE
jgi:uncharacterized protein (TIGR03437 family)